MRESLSMLDNTERWLDANNEEDRKILDELGYKKQTMLIIGDVIHEDDEVVKRYNDANEWRIKNYRFFLCHKHTAIDEVGIVAIGGDSWLPELKDFELRTYH